MARLRIVGVGLGASLFAASLSAATINNPGFETPVSGNPDGWGIPVFANLVDFADVSAEQAHSGSQSLKFTAPGANQQTEVFQGVGGTSGDSTTALTFSVWVYTSSAAAWTDSFFVLGIEFKHTLPGGGDVFVDGGELVVVPESLIPGSWTQLTFTDTASGEWDFLVLKLKTASGVGGTGVLYVDDAEAFVPEPASTALVGLGALALRRRR